MKSFRNIIGAIMLAALVRPVLAQTAMFEGFLSSPGTGAIETNLRNRTFWEPIAKGRAQVENTQPRNGPRFLGPPIRKPPDLAVLRFTPDPLLRKAIASEWVARLAGGQSSSPLGRFLTESALSGMHRQMVAAGLSPTSVGDAMTFFVASHWSMARGNAAPPPKPTLLAFRKQLVELLAEQPAAPRMTNAAKQRQSDSALLLNAVMLRAMEEAQGDPEATAGIAASAGQLLKGMGFDPKRFNLTARGLVPAR